MRTRFLLPKVLICVWLFLGGVASAATYFVKPNGNNAASGTTPESAFQTFTRAARALNHGDSIVLAPGIYKESVFLAERFGQTDQRIAIMGDESGKLAGVKPGPVVLESPNTSAPALHAFRLKTITFSGLTFRGPGEGLRVEQCRDAVVERCSVDGCSRGIVAEGGEGFRLQACVITRCTLGVYLKGAINARVEHVSLAGCTSAGIVMLTCGAGDIRNCILAQNNSNIVADAVSAHAWSTDYNVVSGDVGPWGDVPAIHNVYEWPSASGQDRHSVYIMPAFTAPERYDLHVSPAISWSGGLPGKEIGEKLARHVAQDRDGRPFRERNGHVCAGAYDYPDMQASGAWKKIGALNEGPRQSAGIYRADGSLVRTLLADAAGVRDIWWDGLDDQGQPAPAGDYQLRTVASDLRVVDDGNYGDNGNPLGTYNPDNPERIVALADGGFMVSVPYDEAGMPLRRFTSTGQPIAAANLAQKDFMGLTRHGDELLGVVNRAAPALVRILADCQRVPYPSGVESYPVFAATEKASAVNGVAVIGEVAYVALPAINVVRVMDLSTGKTHADWPVANIKDVASDGSALWALSGSDVILMDSSTGAEQKRFATALPTPITLDASSGRIAVVDRTANRLTVLNAADGKSVLQLGKDHAIGEWTPVSSEHLREPRAAAFLSSGEIALSEAGRIRLLDPASGKVTGELLSNFMDSTVVHPMDLQYVYNCCGVFRVDPNSGAWEWLVEAPMVKVPDPKKKDSETVAALGSPTHAVVLGGKPFIGYHAPNSARLMLFDVSNPLRPREALHSPTNAIIPVWAYGTVCFDAAGNMVGSSSGLQFNVADFQGLDAAGNPKFDFEHPRKLGPPKDPLPRAMSQAGGLAADRKSGDLYYLAVTSRYNKMVPAWGADGTGVGRSSAAGDPLWFSLSSGGNYTSISAVNDGRQTFVLAGKSFGGQLDIFDAGGLRLTTGNWSWPTHYSIGFVDLRYGVHGYLRPDGKVGAYVEDDAIGRFARARLDGAETIRRQATPISWRGSTEVATVSLLPDRTTGEALTREALIPKVSALKVDGNWESWASITPQVLVLPGNINFKRSVPDDLLQTFRQGTAIAVFAHDSENIYVYALVTDDSMHFDAVDSGVLWMYDGLELWLEEEQFGIAFTKDGKPALHKFRFHDRQGAEWKGSGPLPAENVWGRQLTDLSAHPLGRKLAAITGASVENKPGYALMAKIPMVEIKLVGGIAGRGKDILPMTGNSGEIIRIGVVIGGITASGREQDFKVAWPAGMMFSDPTRSYPFVLGK